MNPKTIYQKVFRLIFISLCFMAATAGRATETRPNIIFILIDDLRWDALSCMGHPVARTPNIDRIAKEGALFKNFFVSMPLCSPSRSSFLTGQYAHKTGVIDNTDRTALSRTLVTFPRLLHDGGYESAYVGKWHMGNDSSPRPGFDYWVCLPGQGQYENPKINVNGKFGEVNGYVTDLLNEHAIKFITQEHKKPFVLYLAHKAVHGPFKPAERHKNLYADVEFKIPPNVNDLLKGKPILTREISDEPAPPKNKPLFPQENAGNKSKAAPGHFSEKSAIAQLRCLAAVDDGVGQIFNALEQTKQLDNTMLIFSSDNGYFWGEHGLGDKRWAYEESIRDPLLIRFPKLVEAGTTFDQIVLNIDIAPTLLELGGVAIPKNIQGRSILPLLKGDADWRHAALLEYFQEK
ncbi:MAG: sulfatase, partial [Verrucomicrobiota bacterium]|nr:sulfatase [Verrucomicrobiota bacterium]